MTFTELPHSSLFRTLSVKRSDYIHFPSPLLSVCPSLSDKLPIRDVSEISASRVSQPCLSSRAGCLITWTVWPSPHSHLLSLCLSFCSPCFFLVPVSVQWWERVIASPGHHFSTSLLAKPSLCLLSVVLQASFHTFCAFIPSFCPTSLSLYLCLSYLGSIAFSADWDGSAEEENT